MWFKSRDYMVRKLFISYFLWKSNWFLWKYGMSRYNQDIVRCFSHSNNTNRAKLPIPSSYLLGKVLKKVTGFSSNRSQMPNHKYLSLLLEDVYVHLSASHVRRDFCVYLCLEMFKSCAGKFWHLLYIYPKMSSWLLFKYFSM